MWLQKRMQQRSLQVPKSFAAMYSVMFLWRCLYSWIVILVHITVHLSFIFFILHLCSQTCVIFPFLWWILFAVLLYYWLTVRFIWGWCWFFVDVFSLLWPSFFYFLCDIILLQLFLFHSGALSVMMSDFSLLASMYRSLFNYHCCVWLYHSCVFKLV